jgi:hypothetical protein
MTIDKIVEQLRFMKKTNIDYKCGNPITQAYISGKNEIIDLVLREIEK